MPYPQFFRRLPSLALAVVIAATFACAPADSNQNAEEDSAADESSAGQPFVAEYIARDYAFIGPSELPSGWVTLRLKNEGMEHHFVFLTLMPEGRTIEDYGRDVGPAFGEAWEGLVSGTVDKAGAAAILAERMPEWYASAVVMGGPGLIGPGLTEDATVQLTPGDYVMECYVKTAEGVFHVALGMAIPVTVTEEDSGAAPPEADFEITLFNDGLEVEGAPREGEQTVAVHFDEQPAAGLGNDVHVVRLSRNTDLGALVEWMDWMNVDGLREPAPATFVGGVQEGPPGTTAYFTVDLEPGRYALIAEPGATRGLVQEFVIE
jgi:hypothetical protein